MYYLVFVDGTPIGSTNLPHRDDGMAVALGPFYRMPAYEAVRSVFKKYWDSQPERAGEPENNVLLTQYYAEREALGLYLQDNYGVRFTTTWIHIVDAHTHDECEVSAHIPDNAFWTPARPAVPTLSDRIECEIASFSIPGLREWAQSLLIVPRVDSRIWMHEVPSPRLQVHIVAERSDKTCCIGFCDSRPQGPWRIIVPDDRTFGRDDSWYTYLEDAFVALGFPGQIPDDYEVR